MALLNDQFEVRPDAAARRGLRGLVDDYCAAQALVPPLSQAELETHARQLTAAHGLPAADAAFLMVLINNAVWQAHLAGVPFERRILLLPLCLRAKDTCPGTFDEFGLICEGCGRCCTGGLQNEAERLGYTVLVAEGTTVVKQLLETGQVEAVVGVGCMESLVKTFPLMVSDAIPGLAIPLYRNGCDHTGVDEDWVLETVRLERRPFAPARRLLPQLRTVVESWFERDALATRLGGESTATGRLALDWLAKAGKRWRPLLTAAVYAALTDRPEGELPAALTAAAVATECFHKASLIHDDIEDGDPARYDEPALHVAHGVPVALNVGDYLLGEGYRLLAAGEAPADVRLRLLQCAADGHRRLCAGQGEELAWTRHPYPLTVGQVLDIFRGKTAPAFEVALCFGAILAGADRDTDAVLVAFSAELGVAYQIRDDLDDLTAALAVDGGAALCPSLPLAMAFERLPLPKQEQLLALCRQAAVAGPTAPLQEIGQLVSSSGVREPLQALLAEYRQRTFAALAPLQNVNLKTLLFRAAARILGATV